MLVFPNHLLVVYDPTSDCMLYSADDDEDDEILIVGGSGASNRSMQEMSDLEYARRLQVCTSIQNYSVVFIRN